MLQLIHKLIKKEENNMITYKSKKGTLMTVLADGTVINVDGLLTMANNQNNEFDAKQLVDNYPDDSREAYDEWEAEEARNWVDTDTLEYAWS